MPNTTASTNMSMPIPTVSVDPGPQWGLDLNSCLNILDAHDHTTGYGAQITPGGINISSDLTFLSNNAISLRSARFSSNAAVLVLAADLNCLYTVTNDLYYNDGLGNNVRITQSGGVAGSPGSISNLTSPASAAYVAVGTTFVWQSAANTAAYMDCSSLLIRNITANSYACTLNAPAAMGANLALTLPSLPASQKFMTLDNTGLMSAPYVVDNSTIQIIANTIQVPTSGITEGNIANGAVTTAKIGANAVTTAKIDDLNVTRAKLAALGQQVSSSSGTFSVVTASGETAVTNLSVTITVTGRPVWVGLIPDGTAGTSIIGGDALVSTNAIGVIYKIKRSSVEFARFNVNAYGLSQIPVTAIQFIDTAAVAGTYTYTVTAESTGFTGSNAYCYRALLVAYEIG